LFLRALVAVPWHYLLADYNMLRAVPALSLVALVFVQAGSPEHPERNVAGSAVSSIRDPRVQINLPESAKYVGADRWILYGIADCELHAFVEADAHKKVQRLYWIQFEGYVPSRPELAHTYDSPRHTVIGGLDFYVDTWPRSNREESKAGSDREHIEKLMVSKGYKMPANMMYVRLVHLLDDKKRKELMIIYGEDLAPTGFTAADLAEGGKSRTQWPALENALIARAEKAVSLSTH
jgi:hypothetical protein